LRLLEERVSDAMGSPSDLEIDFAQRIGRGRATVEGDLVTLEQCPLANDDLFARASAHDPLGRSPVCPEVLARVSPLWAWGT
jgi:hypothetical protein